MSITGNTDLGDGQLALTVDAEPTSTAVDAAIGNLIIDQNNDWYRKLVAGSNTNVQKVPGNNGSRRIEVTGSVNTISTTWVVLLTTTFTTRPTTTALEIRFSGSIRQSNSGQLAHVQLVVAGTPVRAATGRSTGANSDIPVGIAARVAVTNNTSVTVLVNWRASSNTIFVDPTLSQNPAATLLEHAILTIEELSE